MKSIIQEASSIAKAIELGWLKAGKPQQFSVKIFQEAEKNFFGMTTKPAKIAFLFNEQQEQASSPKPTAQPKIRQAVENKPIDRPVERPVVKKQQKNEFPPEPKTAPARKVEARPLDDEKKPSILWNDDLTHAAQEWIKNSLISLGYEDVTFTTSARKQLLKIEFSTSLLADVSKQKNLFRSLAFLMLQSLRRQFKRPLRNARVVLLCEDDAN